MSGSQKSRQYSSSSHSRSAAVRSFFLNAAIALSICCFDSFARSPSFKDACCSVGTWIGRE